MQDDRSLSGQDCACRQKSGVEANSRRIPGNLGFPSKQNLPDQFQFRVPAFEFVGIVYAGNFSSPATDLVPRKTLLAQTAKPVELLKAISPATGEWGQPCAWKPRAARSTSGCAQGGEAI